MDVKAGYKSSIDDWHAFLDCWKTRTHERLRRDGVDYIPITWPLADENLKASEAALKALEDRIGQRLPPSYRDFVYASGPAFRFGYPDQDTKMLDSGFAPLANVDLFKVLFPDDWKIWGEDWPTGRRLSDAEYYRYGYRDDRRLMPDSVLYRAEQLGQTLFVGEYAHEGYFLLNPSELTVDGEWEAWELSWHEGVARYRSFAEMMQNIYYADAESPPHGPPFSTTLLRSSCARLLRTAATEEEL